MGRLSQLFQLFLLSTDSHYLIFIKNIVAQSSASGSGDFVIT